MHRVEILYFDGCPNFQPAVDLVHEVVGDLGIEASVRTVKLRTPEDARRLHFLGSPSIRVDGTDIEPAAKNRKDFGFSCRTYAGEGLPPREMVAAALTGTTLRPMLETQRGEGLAMTTAVGAAIVSSACCWFPLTLAGTGVSAAAFAGPFETLRPYALAVASIAVAIGFYTVYVRKPATPDTCGCAPVARRGALSRAALWAAVLGVVVFAALPTYVGLLSPVPAETNAVSNERGATHVALDLTGMTCEGCTVGVRNALAAVPGVLGVEVRWAFNDATVRFDSAHRPNEAELLAAVQRAGYDAIVAKTAGGDLVPPERIRP